MLVLHKLDNLDEMVTLDLDDSAWTVTHAYNGFDTLEFEVASNSKYYKDLHEECKVTFVGSRATDMRFNVKNVDEHSDFVTVDCDIDLDDWKASIIQSFRVVNSTLANTLNKILPSGWSHSGTERYTQRTTVEKTEGEPIEAATPLGILDYVTEAYGCVFNFDNLNKVIYAMKPDAETASGEYVSDELNLTSRPGFVGNSSNFATRLYAYGKKDDTTGEPLTFADINDGKPYVEDFGYSDKVICIGWSDERYTVKEDLLADAKKKLASVSKPIRSYSCDVAQLNYNVWMYRVVTLLDTVRNIRVDHQVVEWKERAKPSKDEVSLSAVTPTIESLVKGAGNVNDKIAEAKEETETAYTKAIAEATKRITGSYGGYFKWIEDADGNFIELVNLADSEDINKATKVWRWNKEGLGHSNKGYDGVYDLALLADGSINATMMTVGIIQGGRSYWNLNTGELKLQGEFTASYTDDSSGVTQTLTLDPDHERYSTQDPTIISHGPALVFKTSESGSGNAFIARTIERDGDEDLSYLDIAGGLKSSTSPGAYAMLGSYRSSSSSALAGRVRLSASDVYMSPKSHADLILTASADESVTRAVLSATNSDGYTVGLTADSKNELVWLTGKLSSFGGATFVTYSHGGYSASQNSVKTINWTLPSPAKYGAYRPFMSIASASADTVGPITSAVYGASASGWTMYAITFPSTVVTSVSKSWSTSTVGGYSGVVRNLSITVNQSTVHKTFTYLIYSFAVLV